VWIGVHDGNIRHGLDPRTARRGRQPPKATAALGAGAYLLDVPCFHLCGILFELVEPLHIWPDVL